MRRRIVLVVVCALLTLAITTSVASADRDRQRERGRNIPEVPIALVLPLVGAVTIGAAYGRTRWQAHRAAKQREDALHGE